MNQKETGESINFLIKVSEKQTEGIIEVQKSMTQLASKMLDLTDNTIKIAQVIKELKK